MPAATTVLTTAWAASAGTAMTAIVICSRRTTSRNSRMSWMATPLRERWPILSARRVEQRDDLEPFVAEAGIVGERQPEIAGAHDRDAHATVEAENLPQVAAQLLDVVADAADAELAEVREVLADLRGVEVELLGQRLRRHRAHAGRVERVQAAQVDRQPVGRQLGNRLGRRRAPATGRLFAFFTSSDLTRRRAGHGRHRARRFRSCRGTVATAAIPSRVAMAVTTPANIRRMAHTPPTPGVTATRALSAVRSRPASRRPSSRSRPSSSGRCSA